MTTPLMIECAFHFKRKGQGNRKKLEDGHEQQLPPVQPGRVPRISKLLALAHRFDQLIRSGEIVDYSQLAELGHVTRAQITQVMGLLGLDPGIQEQILFLPSINRGRDSIHLHQLLPIAAMLDWRKQRPMWKKLMNTNVVGKLFLPQIF